MGKAPTQDFVLPPAAGGAGDGPPRAEAAAELPEDQLPEEEDQEAQPETDTMPAEAPAPGLLMLEDAPAHVPEAAYSTTLPLYPGFGAGWTTACEENWHG